MPEEIINQQEQVAQEQENQEKVQHSIGEVMSLMGKLKMLNLKIAVVSMAENVKQWVERKKQLHAQAKAHAVEVCTKYKLGKEQEAEAIKEVMAAYDAEFEQMKEIFEAAEGNIRSQRERNDDEFDDIIIKEAKIRKAYKQEKKSKEYKEFMEMNKKIQKDIEFYENSTDIPPETVERIVAELKKIAARNPLNKYVEQLKRIEERKKQIIKENRELKDKLDELGNNLEKAWDQLDINKNKALANTKDNDLIKPKLKQRLSNFFTSQAKRNEKAKAELKRKSVETINSVKSAGGAIITGAVSGVRRTKENIKQWYENKKEQRQVRINEMYASLTASYQEKLGDMQETRERQESHRLVDEFVPGKVYPVPEAKVPVIEGEPITVEHFQTSQDKEQVEDKGFKVPEPNGSNSDKGDDWEVDK